MHADEEGDWETDDEREATWRRMRAWGWRQSGRQMDVDSTHTLMCAIWHQCMCAMSNMVDVCVVRWMHVWHIHWCVLYEIWWTFHRKHSSQTSIISHILIKIWHDATSAIWHDATSMTCHIECLRWSVCDELTLVASCHILMSAHHTSHHTQYDMMRRVWHVTWCARHMIWYEISS